MWKRAQFRVDWMRLLHPTADVFNGFYDRWGLSNVRALFLTMIAPLILACDPAGAGVSGGSAAGSGSGTPHAPSTRPRIHRGRQGVSAVLERHGRRRLQWHVRGQRPHDARVIEESSLTEALLFSRRHRRSPLRASCGIRERVHQKRCGSSGWFEARDA